MDSAGESAVEDAVEAAVAGTADLEDVPVGEHVARFDAVHKAMSHALSAIDGA